MFDLARPLLRLSGMCFAEGDREYCKGLIFDYYEPTMHQPRPLFFSTIAEALQWKNYKGADISYGGPPPGIVTAVDYLTSRESVWETMMSEGEQDYGQGGYPASYTPHRLGPDESTGAAQISNLDDLPTDEPLPSWDELEGS
ncbi:hypothetical protein [Caudoviricetes sp.]|nr:hypothetical protein [Caudoviricetes sp.]UOF81869.1 hypothetical protein [Caudoviricetes sp.]